jgi:parallel beta-helix repeat protein
MKRLVSGLMLILLITSILAFMFNVQPVKGEWTGTVYIRADGSIDPPDAPIITYDNVTYTLTGNITITAYGACALIVERDNIVINGNGYMLQACANDTIGVMLTGRTNVTIRNMTIKNFGPCISLTSSSYIKIIANDVIPYVYAGILLQDSTKNCIITKNNLKGRGWGWGILIATGGLGNVIIANNITGFQWGIECRGRILIEDNIIKNNWYGIVVSDSNNTIRNNNITDNDYGIYLSLYSSNNSIYRNTVRSSCYGIYLSSSSENVIYENNITYTDYGIRLSSSSNNRVFHNNFVNNTEQVDLYDLMGNIWDDGYPSGGNYWSDYTDIDIYSGPYQNETGGDGIWDHPYVIDANNRDNYPLVKPWSPAPLIGPDLTISSSDVSFSEDNPFDGQTITITATVRNIGKENAENVTIRFLDGKTMVSEQKIPVIYSGSEVSVSIKWTAKGEGFHPIKVIVDPYNAIIETDEGNNEATRSILVGKIPLVGGIIVEASVTPETTIAGSTVSVRGFAKYNTTYGADMPVAGADVSIVITGWVQEKTYTIRDGSFEAEITAPFTQGYYIIAVTVTDFTFTERVELCLNVTSVEGVDLTLYPGDISFSPSDPIEGQIVSVTATIHNIGTVDAYNVLVAFYDGGELIGNRTISFVPARGTASVMLSWNATPWGWHSIEVVIDPENTIAEVNENNNQASKGVYVYPPLPDPTPTSIAFSDSTPAVNQTITISTNIRNIGGVSASNVLVSFYIDGQLIENLTIAWIAGKGGSQTAFIQYSFATAGWHRICVVADPDNNIIEVDENNNNLCIDIYVHPPLPDLTPSIAFSNNNPTVGDLITIYTTVYNIGEIDAQNVTLSIFDDDIRICYLTTPSLNAGGHETVEVLWNATPAGWHRIKAVVDENNTIEEVDEANNIATRYIYVSPPPEQASDLCIHSEDIAFSKVVAEEGEEVIINATVHNIGMVDAENVTVTFYIDDVQLGSPKTIASIPVSGSETVSTKWTASKAGSHVVKVVADVPMEANKTNNVATRGIIVGEHNVAITSVTPAKNIVSPGEILIINVTAINKGNFIETFNLTLYANTTVIRTLTITLESGNCTTVTIAWNTAGYAYGNYTIRAYIEPVPRETITEDNTYIDGTVQILQTYTLTITTTAGGTTSPTPGTYTYTAGSTVQVTAIPSSGYIFDHWELNGSNVGSANPYTIHIDNNYILKAIFTPAPAPLTVSISPTSASILVGQQTTFTSTVSGGTPPYNYQWYLNGNPVSGATSDSWIFTPTTSGTFYVYLKITDSKGNTAQSETARITVATVPVGGYSVPIQLPTTAKPTTIHIALLTILTAIFIKIKQKTRRKHRQ